MSNPTRIDWCSHTINPVVGCQNGCPWCYARRQAPRVAARAAGASGKPVCGSCAAFIPHLHPERLDHIGQGKGRRVFIGSMCDLWSEGVLPEWREAIWERVAANPQNVYLVLTKRWHEIGYKETWRMWGLPNLWRGVTCTEDSFKRTVMHGSREFVSAEPLLGEVRWPGDRLWHPDWLIIGPQTGPGARVPDVSVAWHLLNAAKTAGIPVWTKGSCEKSWPGLPVLRELPVAMTEYLAAHGKRRAPGEAPDPGAAGGRVAVAGDHSGGEREAR